MKEKLQTSIWRTRDVRVILPARSLGMAGSATTLVAVLLHLHGTGAGPLAVAAVMACVAVPAIATMGLAGHVADSRDSRTILLVTTAVKVAACLTLGAVPATAVIFPAMLVIQLAQAVEQPTWSALLPRVVGEDRIGNAISWQQGLGAVTSPVGAAMGGIAVGLWDLRWAFLLNAACFAVELVAAMLVRTRRGGRRDGPVPARGNPAHRPRWNAGLRILRRDSVVWPLFVAMLAFAMLAEGINPAEVFLARDALEASEVEYGLVDAFAGAGAITGAALAARMHGQRTWVRATLVGFGASGAALVVAGAAPGFWFYASTLAVLMASFGMGNATFGALLISRTPEADRGKAQATLSGLGRACGLVALALGGLAATAVGPRWTFALGGLAGMVVMLIAGIRSGRRTVADHAGASAARVASKHPRDDRP